MLDAQKKFVEILGADRLRAFQDAAVGIQKQPHSKGRPDIATYSAQERMWRFIEAKRKAEDALREDQKAWLENIADFFGAGSAIELRFELGG
jgi:hypothetical protein